MKSAILFTTSLLLLLCACQSATEKSKDSNDTAAVKANPKGDHIDRSTYTVGIGSSPSSLYIPLDSANRMVSSYMASINAPANDSDLESITFSVDSLKKMFAGAGGGNIKYLKFTFAHTLRYINAGGYGVNAGYLSGALTLIVSGYNTDGNYVYMPYNNMVLDNGMPCPLNCETKGSASADTFPASITGHK